MDIRIVMDKYRILIYFDVFVKYRFGAGLEVLKKCGEY